MLNVWLHTFARDTKVHIALILVLADFVLGVIAAFKVGNFRISYVADFLRNDILFKLVPYFVLYALAIVAGNTSVFIPGLDFGVLAGAAYAVLVAAWIGSIVSSIRTLGLAASAPNTTATVLGAENAAPPKD
jgi:hypothetical protein